MAGRIRSIKPEILDDEVVAALPHLEFRLFVSMFVMADDYGNLGGIAARVKGTALWGTEDSVDKVKTALEHMAEVGLIEIYRVRGQAFIHLSGWSKHQKVDKPGRPIYPSPDQADSSGYEDSRDRREDVASIRETPALDQDHDQRPTTSSGPVGDPGLSPRKPKSTGRKRPASDPADDPQPTDADRAYASAREIDVDVEWPAMFDNYRKRNETTSDWSSSWRTWCRNAVKFREERRARAGPSPRPARGLSALINANPDLFEKPQ